MAHGTERPEDGSRSRGSDLSTLIVAALAAVVAALVTSRLWSGGTLVSTAMTPVIVSLVKEYMQRPVEKIGAVARAPLVAVRATPERVGAGVSASPPPEAERRGQLLLPTEPDPDDFEALDTLLPPGEEATTETPYRVYRKRPRRATWWRVGLATGMLAFVVAAAVITVPELVGGGSVASTGRTTLFSHHSSTKKSTSTDESKSDKSSSKDADESKSDKSSSSDSSSSSKDRTSPPSKQDSSSSSGSSGDETQPSEPGSSSSPTTTPDSTTGDSTQTTPSTPTPPTTSTPSTPPSSTQP